MPLMEATNTEIAELFDRWNAALQTGDPRKVAQLYAKSAILLPTLSSRLRQSPEAIEEYFEEFLRLKPRSKIIQQNVRLFDDIAINSGVYVFEIEREGQPLSVKARFTFIYHCEGGDWKIIEHHSSLLPED